ncbi:MAG: 1-acyl-sn-glycerol-3-phosphate acyltransferase [Candidatus Margulisbacteria bacterium]|jgi:1-acyl-sn-glycerol-3-phosphate acyltransferase|nr:1-acyl-sn-glycerol-3-phosphate acyltransferase [Candidatus Margulisiibacteriota bacterium]
MLTKLIILWRIIATAVCFGLFGGGSLLLAFIIIPALNLGVRDKLRRRKYILASIRILWRMYIWFIGLLGLFKVYCSAGDRKLLGTLQSRIVIANHPSLVDIVILVSLVKNAVCIARGKLLENFFVQKIIKSVYIANSAGYETIRADAVAALRGGLNLIIFPEGTRTLNEEQLYLQRGTAYIAMEARADIIPIRINTTSKLLRKDQKWYDLGTKCGVYELKVRPEIIVSSLVNAQKSRNINARKITERLKNSIERDGLYSPTAAGQGELPA